MFNKLFLCLGLLGITAQASDFYRQAFGNAIETNDIGRTESVLNSVQDSKRQEQLASYILANSARYENKDIFMRMIQNFGIDPDQQDMSELFSYAVEVGNLDVIKRVYSSVPEKDRQEVINARNSIGQSPLMIATQRGDLNAVDLLLQNGADIDAKEKNGTDIVNIAIRSGNVEVLKCLFKHAQNPEQRKKFLTSVYSRLGKTAVLNCAFYGKKDVFVWLIDEAQKLGIEPEEYISAQDYIGNNVFYYAAMGDSVDIIEYLFESFSTEKSLEMINSKNKWGKTALDIIKNHGRTVQVGEDRL